MTYEIVGTVLLGMFGVASLAVAGILQWQRPAAGEGTTRREGALARPVDGPYGDDPGLAPEPTLAPLEIALGSLLLLFMIPFGPWMAVIAVVPLAAGASAWLGAAVRDAERTRAMEALADPQRPQDGAAAAERRSGGASAAPAAGPEAPAGPDAPAVGPEATAPEPVQDRVLRVGVVATIAAAIAVVLARLPGRGRTLPLLARLTGTAAVAAAADRAEGGARDEPGPRDD